MNIFNRIKRTFAMLLCTTLLFCGLVNNYAYADEGLVEETSGYNNEYECSNEANDNEIKNDVSDEFMNIELTHEVDLLEGDLTKEELKTSKLEEKDIPELLNRKEVEDSEHVNRLYAQEKDLYTAIFQNKDGSKTAYFFSTPIKYVNSKGEVLDKTNKLTSQISSNAYVNDYAFSNVNNDIKLFFPKVLDVNNGVVLETSDIKIEMIPISASPTTETISADTLLKTPLDSANYNSIIVGSNNPVKSSTAVKKETFLNKSAVTDYISFDKVFGEKTEVKYTPKFNGFKEEIVLNEYTGTNKFSFLIKTNGLSLVNADSNYYLIDPLTGEIKTRIDDLIVLDSSNYNSELNNEHNHFYEVETITSDNEYIFSIIIDEEFLLSKETVYPVIIDPSFYYSYTDTSEMIEDSYLREDQENAAYYNELVLKTGTFRNGSNKYEARSLIKATTPLSTNELLEGKTITSAYLHVNPVLNSIKDITGSASDITYVDAYPISAPWTENTVCKNAWFNIITSGYNVSRDNKINYINAGDENYSDFCKINITNIAIDWLLGNCPEYGIMLGMSSQSIGDCVEFYSENCNNAAYQPYFSVNYATPLVTISKNETPGISNNGVYHIKNTNSANKYWDVGQASTNNGANLVLWTVQGNGNANQRFIFKYLGNGEYRICPDHAQNMSLQIVYVSGQGYKLRIYATDNEDIRQIWYIVKTGDNYIFINKSRMHECLTTEGAYDSGSFIYYSSNTNGYLWSFAKRLYPEKIMIDAGHNSLSNTYTYTIDGVQKTYIEGARMWVLQNFIVEELQSIGFYNTICCRTENEHILEGSDLFNDSNINYEIKMGKENEERGKRAEGYDLFIQLHTNAPGSSRETITEKAYVFYPVDEDYDTPSWAQDFADIIVEQMGLKDLSDVDSKSLPNNASKNYYAVMRAAESVGCKRHFIVEHSFHTTASSRQWLLDTSNNENNFRELAKEYARVIKSNFGY